MFRLVCLKWLLALPALPRFGSESALGSTVAAEALFVCRTHLWPLGATGEWFCVCWFDFRAAWI